MPRPQKKGLDDFPQDTDFLNDRRIVSLIGRWGAQAVTYYLYLLCEIFHGEGYYLKLDKDFDSVAAVRLKMNLEDLQQIRDFLLDRELFDAELYQQHQVLSSAWIQERYQLAVRARGNRRAIQVEEDYWLLSSEETEDYIRLCPREHLLRTYPANKKKENQRKENQIIKQNTQEICVVEEEEEERKTCPDLMECYRQNIGKVTPAIKKQLYRCIQEGTPPELVRAAIERGGLSGAHSWRYVQTVLEDCKRRGVSSPDQLKPRPWTPPSAAESSIDYDAIRTYLDTAQDRWKNEQASLPAFSSSTPLTDYGFCSQ